MHYPEIQISAFHAIAIDSVVRKKTKENHMLKYKCCNVIERNIYRSEYFVLLNIMRQNILISYARNANLLYAAFTERYILCFHFNSLNLHDNAKTRHTLHNKLYMKYLGNILYV